ncbi:MAG: serine/threonine-protein kinase, partial [Myxococcota bacterium]|nr:serine/threonine-protein kinase [Myxococcota bacterium]
SPPHRSGAGVSGGDRQKALTEARSLERAGDHMAAVKKYIHAGYAMDASRLLANLGRFGDAGDLLLKALKLSPTEVGTLTGARRSAALKAAVCYARAGRVDDSATIVLALGVRDSVVGTLLEVDDTTAAENLLRNTTRPGQPTFTLEDAARTRAHELVSAGQHTDALRLFHLANDPVEAARVLWSQGSKQEAIALLVDQELWLEAARCQLEAGDTAAALASLRRIQPDSPHFRQACCSLIQVIHDHQLDPGFLDERLDTWDQDAPQNLAELQAMYLWARIVEDHGDKRRAMALLKRIRVRRPGHADVTQRLRRLTGEGGGAPRIVAEAEIESQMFGGQIFEPTVPTPPPTQPGRRRDVRGPAVQFEMPDSTPTAAPAKQNLLPVTPPAPAKRPVTVEALASTAAEAVDTRTGEERAADNTPEAIGPGLVVDGRYEIQAHLGDGATASVYKAFDRDLGECIAMKFFHLMVSRNETMAERMKLEIKLCRKLSHRNIIKIFDLGSFAGHRYLTMELLEGQTLQEAIEETLTPAQTIDILVQACRGLHEAHCNDFVHRDVKPDNLFLTHEGVVKVMDFGIAKQTTAEGMTLTGTILGTPGYMAPEQIDGSSPVSHAADQYAIGSMAFRMFTGTMVFQHDEMMPLLMMHVTETPELPSKRAPDLSPEIDNLVMRLLSKKPSDRFESCGDAADAFEALRQQS